MEQVPSELGRKSGYRSYVVFINCGGADHIEETRYEIKAIGYSSGALALEDNKIYFLRGLFFPTNTIQTTMDQFYFEGSDYTVVGSAEDFKGDFIDGVGVSGLGIVTKLELIIEECCKNLRDKDNTEDPKTLVVTVKHTDYHPTIKPAPTFYVEYRVRPHKYLAGIPRLLKLGRETMFHGYLKDFNEETRCYVVIANRVSTTSGHRDPSEFEKKVVKAEDMIGGSGRPKPKTFTPKPVTAPFKSPIITPTPGANFQSAPADHPTAPMSASASSGESDEALSQAIPKKKRAAPPASKKRPRARPARQTSSSTTLDLTT
ncbi:uncharacterized protein MELLADRAFT_85385 [Melampsora larici-populina 98AG31]|uniref:Uncharacterized protein n=1 Tax=Melampsora larici-populina (strain 98AG31 / pathotype 3-4-7) TaxID=747676 RepID=F4RII0_MELLP|nr:uncharacterized protein MELLADRAFT_85385 [Melampsora larici-populina 98AG31]EGG07830.1 hypothetical protein MELLADRAFT_85385 [Melampsora larici-populina 98AG31]